MPSLGIILLIAGLFVTVGFIGGSLITMWFLDRNARKEVDKDNQPEETAEKESKYPADAIILWRKTESGNLQMGIKRRIISDADMLSAKEKKILILFAKKWLQWLGGEPQTQVSVADDTIISSKTKKETEERLDRVVAFSIDQETSTPAQNGFTANRSPNLTSVEPINSEKVSVRNFSIASQINTILQEMLMNSPLFNRGIQIMDDPKEGVVVWVGSERFLGISEVTDPEVKALIEEAVKAWETQTKI